HARRKNLLLRENYAVDAGLSLYDLTRRQIAVLLRLNQRVLVHRLPKILTVVGGDLAVFWRGLVGLLQFARRRGETNVNGIGVATQYFRPAAPGGAMAFVDDDDGKGILAVVLRQKAGEAFFVVQAQGLVRGDVNARIGCGVAAALCAHDAGVIAE